MKLTKTTVESIPFPATGSAIHYDDELPGFGVRIWSSKKRSYFAQGRVKGEGKQRRITIGQHGELIKNSKNEVVSLTAEIARKLAMGFIASFNDGTDPFEEKKLAKKKALTLHDVAADYCKNRRTKKGGALTAKTVRDIERHIKSNFGDWADKPIIKITSENCRDRFEKISKRSPAQANQAFRILRALINYSSDEENPRLNPVSTLSKKGLWNQNKAKSGAIPLEKIGFVWNMLQDHRTNPALLPTAQTGADIVLFFLLTGCRWSEAAELTWDLINLNASKWSIPDPKNHNPVILPLPKATHAMLTDRSNSATNNYVFTGRIEGQHIKEARGTMAEVSKLAGLHLTPHDLRRTFIAIGIKLKIEMWKLKLLTYHISKGDVTLDHYTEITNLTYLSGEIEQISAWIVEQGKIAAADNVVPINKAA